VGSLRDIGGICDEVKTIFTARRRERRGAAEDLVFSGSVQPGDANLKIKIPTQQLLTQRSLVSFSAPVLHKLDYEN
jgi:hypothetical protein